MKHFRFLIVMDSRFVFMSRLQYGNCVDGGGQYV